MNNLTAPAAFFAGALLACALNWLALVSWRRAAGQHWTERARRLYPARVGAALNLWLLPANGVLLARLVHSDASWLLALTAFTGWLGAMLGTWPFSREMFPWLTFRGWLHLAVVGWCLSFAGWFLLLGAAAVMPENFGWPVAGVATAVLLITFWLLFGGGRQLLRGCRLLAPPDERLQRIVATTAVRMGVSVRATGLLESVSSYAAALPITRELIFSRRLLELHPDDEIAAICAHELAHLSESKRVTAGRILASFAFTPWILFKPALHTWQFAGLAVLAFSWGLLLVFAQRLARRMEVRADQMATANQPEPGTYARALARLYEANQIPAVMSGSRRTHPHLYDRLIAAGVTPDYPRPKPPARLGWTTGLVMIIAGILLGLNFAAGVSF